MDPKETLAAINASLNALATLLLIGGFVFIKRRNYRAHAACMIAALVASGVFLCTYLYSNFVYGSRSTGLEPSLLRTVYFLVLFPHVIMAIVMLPGIAMAVWRAATRKWDKHKRIARPTWYVWVYVSISGVVVYWMLYHLIPAMK